MEVSGNIKNSQNNNPQQTSKTLISHVIKIELLLLMNRMNANHRKRNGIQCCLCTSIFMIVTLLIFLMVYIIDLTSKNSKIDYYRSVYDINTLSCSELCSGLPYQSIDGKNCCEYQSGCSSKHECLNQLAIKLNYSRDNDTRAIVILGVLLLLFLVILCIVSKKYRRIRAQLLREYQQLRIENVQEPIFHAARNSNRNVGRINQSQNTQNQKGQRFNYDSFTHRDSQANCCICLDPFSSEKAALLTCGHLFHSKCIKDWSKKGDSCPICRTKQ